MHESVRSRIFPILQDPRIEFISFDSNKIDLIDFEH